MTGMLGVNSLEGETRLVFLGVSGSDKEFLPALGSLCCYYVLREGGALTFIWGLTIV